jgi:hypothetical protein
MTKEDAIGMRDPRDVRVTEEGFLIQKMLHKDCIKRIIDWKRLGVSEEYIDEQSKLSYEFNDVTVIREDKRVRPSYTDGGNDEMDRFYVADLCLPYNPPPDDTDLFVWYDDLGPLCGSAGYIRFRDGFVYGTRVIVRA